VSGWAVGRRCEGRCAVAKVAKWQHSVSSRQVLIEHAVVYYAYLMRAIAYASLVWSWLRWWVEVDAAESWLTTSSRLAVDSIACGQLPRTIHTEI